MKVTNFTLCNELSDHIYEQTIKAVNTFIDKF